MFLASILEFGMRQNFMIKKDASSQLPPKMVSSARPMYGARFERAGRPLSFRASFDEHAPFVRAILRRSGVTQSDREDLLQEIFVVVHRKLHEYDGRAPFRSWLYGICARTVSSYRRSARMRYEPTRANVVLDECEAHLACDAEHSIDLRRACALLEGLLIQLDEEKRTVFVLFEIEGLPMTEIVKIVGCPLQTAYSRLHAARKAMRALVVRQQIAQNLPPANAAGQLARLF
jgi:RNA polymerase sigma-70 factor (ECF subfamily)